MTASRHHRHALRALLGPPAVLAACAAALALPGAAQAAPPANDAFAAAGLLLSGSPSLSGTTAEATREAGEPHNDGSDVASIWYRWLAPSSGPYTVDLCGPGTANNTTLGVYTGGAVGALTPVGRNDDAGWCEGAASTGASAVTFRATAGTTYRISVAATAADERGAFAGRIHPGANTRIGGLSGFSADGRFAAAGVASGSPTGTVECSLDGAPWSPCDGGFRAAGLASGKHDVRMRATVDGKVDPTPARQEVVVDPTPPDTGVVQGASVPGAPSFTLSAGEPGSTWECSVDGTPFAGCGTPLKLANICDAAHTLAVRAVDHAGNADPTPATKEFGGAGPCGDAAATTQPAKFVKPNTAQATGTVAAGGGAAVAWFEYGPTASYGSETPPELVTGSAGKAVADTVFGRPGEVVHYRAVARTSGGAVVRGADQVVTLAPAVPGAPTLVTGAPKVGPGLVEVPYTVAGEADPDDLRQGIVLVVARVVPSGRQVLRHAVPYATDGASRSGTLRVEGLPAGSIVDVQAAATSGGDRMVSPPPVRITTPAEPGPQPPVGLPPTGEDPSPGDTTPPGPPLPPVVTAPGGGTPEPLLSGLRLDRASRAKLRAARWSAQVRCGGSCRVVAVLRAGRATVATASGRRTAAGTLTLRPRPSRAGAARLKRTAKPRLALELRAVSASGKTLATLKRTVRFS